jgi:erythrocyte band 7 integral membrane protein
MADGPGICACLITFLSLLMVFVTFPLSLLFTVKVVQVRFLNCCYRVSNSNIKEYERAVIFRLGRLLSGGAKGPGIFFIIPCVDSYTKVDMRVTTFDVPPQEVITFDTVVDTDKDYYT